MAGLDNKHLAFGLGGVILVMIGLSFAAVPLYDAFCRVTGFGGTVARTQDGTRPILDRTIKVRFAANTARDMPWDFTPTQGAMDVQVGANNLAFYEAANLTGRTLTGTATYNVAPFKAARYFAKIECFCFTRQTLTAGQRVDMPVTFFIDPAIADDPALVDVSEITLSYTFFLDDESAGS